MPHQGPLWRIPPSTAFGCRPQLLIPVTLGIKCQALLLAVWKAELLHWPAYQARLHLALLVFSSKAQVAQSYFWRHSLGLLVAGGAREPHCWLLPRESVHTVTSSSDIRLTFRISWPQADRVQHWERSCSSSGCMILVYSGETELQRSSSWKGPSLAWASFLKKGCLLYDNLEGGTGRHVGGVQERGDIG